MAQERKQTYGPEPETEGGGIRGGPKRATRHGPAPARHIPWPEIFKHHISLVEGHLKMIDMIRKHTVEGSGNWKMIMELVDRTNEMLRMSKHQSRNFVRDTQIVVLRQSADIDQVPPPRQREQVPLGSSSASMYPGYSPAEHKYGKAAEDYGRVAAEARKRGLDISHPDVEYQVGQSKGIKRRTLAEMRAARAAKGQSDGSGSGSVFEGPTKTTPKENATLIGTAGTKRPREATTEGESDNPYFVIDTKPTLVNLSGMPNQPMKRGVSLLQTTSPEKHKKAKKHHEGELPYGEEPEKVELEDISEQVDARLKVKEEKRKQREEKKRKRESNDEHTPAGEASSTKAGDHAMASETDKPKRKRVKRSTDKVLVDRSIPEKRGGEDNGEAGNSDGKRKKKRKKGNGAVEEV